MKTLVKLLSASMLVVLLMGCGENSKGPDQQVTPSTADASTQQTPPPDRVEFDKEPALLKRVEPVYPELAMKAGLEGRVWVKIWVGTDGTAKQVVVLKSDSDIFNQPTIDAAKQFLFSPAYIKDKPVDVWVSVPFKYTLADKPAQTLKTPAGMARPEELSFMKGYTAGKEELLRDFEKIAAAARESGKPNADLEQRIQKLKTELPALKEALRAMQASR